MLSTKILMAFENQEKYVKEIKASRLKAHKLSTSYSPSLSNSNENARNTGNITVPRNTKKHKNTPFVLERELSSRDDGELTEEREYYDMSDNAESDGEFERRILPVVPFNSPYSSSDEDDYTPYNNAYEISNPVVPYNTPYSSDDEDDENNERRTLFKGERNGNLSTTSNTQLSRRNGKRYSQWPKRKDSLMGRRVEATKVEKLQNGKGTNPRSTGRRHMIASGVWFGGKSPIENTFRSGIQEDLDLWG